MGSDFRAHIEALVREAWADPRTTHELISAALADPDGDTYWDAVSVLHRRGSGDILDAAGRLCGSECQVERTLAANILGQLGIPDRTFPRESVALVVRLLDTDTNADVLQAACVAAGHIGDPAAVPAVARWKSHPSVAVRHGVVVGLSGVEDGLAVETLIELTTAPDGLVRDWATFALGSQIDLDTPAIREALFARTADADEVVRGEALVGLARRRDRRVVEPLARELARHPDVEYGRYAGEAAEEVAAPELLPALRRLKQAAGPGDPTFDEAIARCSGRTPPDGQG